MREWVMAKMREYPVEVRERAVRLVLEHRGEYGRRGRLLLYHAEVLVVRL